MIVTALIIFALILINALYVAAEFAAVSVRRNQIRQWAEEGNWLAKAMLPVLMDTVKLDRYIAACQFGITISSLILGAYGQVRLTGILSPLLVNWGGLQEIAANSIAAVVVLILLTATQVVLGELMPKTIALQFPKMAALYTFLPVKWSLHLFSWFVDVLNGSGLLILRVFSVSPGRHSHVHSPDEIDMLLEESREGGVLNTEEHARLHTALTLGERTAEQIMVPRLQLKVLDINADLETITKMLEYSPHTHIPVYEGSRDNIVGILHLKEWVLHYACTEDKPHLRKLVRKVPFVPEGMHVDKLLSSMREKKVQQVFVLDEYGRIVGLVTLDDLIGEFLGDIGSEFESLERVALFELLPEGQVRLSGLMRMHKLRPYLRSDVVFPGKTVAGCVLELLDHFPVEGEALQIAGHQVIVEKISRNTIVSVLVMPDENGSFGDMPAHSRQKRAGEIFSPQMTEATETKGMAL